MSLPEVLLLLDEQDKRDCERALLKLQTQSLANFAVWDKDAGGKLERLHKTLLQKIQPPGSASTEDVATVLSQWGVDTANV